MTINVQTFELPPLLTVEAMSRFCREMMKDGKGQYVFWHLHIEYPIANATPNDRERMVLLS